MNLRRLIPPLFFMFSISLPAVAQEYAQDLSDTSSETVDDIKKLVEYLYNLGAYLGYDLSQTASSQGSEPSHQLLESSTAQLVQNYAFNTLLGAITVNAVSTSLSYFVPSSFETYSALNYFANYTYSSQPYSSTGQSTISVSSLIDQKTYQNDPVSQAVLNILATPDHTYCMSTDETTWSSDCSLLYQHKIMSNVVGTLPKSSEFSTYSYNQQFLSELNSNTLIAPLLYSQEGQETTSSSTGTNTDAGLIAQNQAQAAQNFIRFATGAVTPISLPTKSDYTTIYSQAFNEAGNVSEVDQKKAQATLAKYFASLRAYAAQTSVAYSNLYYILSKRMPQNQSSSSGTTLNNSQAMSEFTMATRRLYDPSKSSGSQWIEQINTASSATVQKEMAILLAEINYQLYLNRLQNERVLLTNSILLLQNAANNPPEAPTTSTVEEQGS